MCGFWFFAWFEFSTFWTWAYFGVWLLTAKLIWEQSENQQFFNIVKIYICNIHIKITNFGHLIFEIFKNIKKFEYFECDKLAIVQFDFAVQFRRIFWFDSKQIVAIFIFLICFQFFKYEPQMPCPTHFFVWVWVLRPSIRLCVVYF